MGANNSTFLLKLTQRQRKANTLLNFSDPDRVIYPLSIWSVSLPRPPSPTPQTFTVRRKTSGEPFPWKKKRSTSGSDWLESGFVSCPRVQIRLLTPPLSLQFCLRTLQKDRRGEVRRSRVDLRLPPGGGWARSGESDGLRSVLRGHLAARGRNSKEHRATEDFSFPTLSLHFQFFINAKKMSPKDKFLYWAAHPHSQPASTGCAHLDMRVEYRIRLHFAFRHHFER